MFNLKIFETNNQAFEFPEEEVARILSVISEQILSGKTFGKAIDYNGNVVGEWCLNK